MQLTSLECIYDLPYHKYGPKTLFLFESSRYSQLLVSEIRWVSCLDLRWCLVASVAMIFLFFIISLIYWPALHAKSLEYLHQVVRGVKCNLSKWQTVFRFFYKTANYRNIQIMPPLWGTWVTLSKSSPQKRKNDVLVLSLLFWFYF